jgi:hypothetical protein
MFLGSSSRGLCSVQVERTVLAFLLSLSKKFKRWEDRRQEMQEQEMHSDGDLRNWQEAERIPFLVISILLG